MSSPVPAPLPRPTGNGPQSVVDQVAESILDLILSNQLKPGDPVAIQGLSEMLSVSHVPIREALRRLEGRGLIEFRRGQRPRIAPIDFADFEDVYRLRALLEGHAALRNDGMSAAQLDALESALAELERLLGHGSAFDLYSAHERFHLLMIPEATTLEKRLIGELWVASQQYIQLFISSQARSRARDTIAHLHRLLLDAARSGDRERIHEAVVQHVLDSRTMMADAVRAVTGD